MSSQERPQNYDEWVDRLAVQVQQSSQPLNWNAITLQTMQIFPIRDYFAGPILEETVLGFVLKGGTNMNIMIENSGRKYHHGLCQVGSFYLVPAGTSYQGNWDGQYSAAMASFQPSKLSELAAEFSKGDPQQLELFPVFNHYDSLIYQLTLALINNLEQQDLLGNLYADSITYTMMLHLLRHYSSAAKVKFRAEGKLSFAQERRLEDYIEAQLENKISLAELAALLPMSVPHLQRLFIVSFGMPVYKFVILRRIQRAKLLLADKHKSLFDIALECGFASQSHFNHHFKAHVGISPSQFARQQR